MSVGWAGWEHVFADEASRPGSGFSESNCVVDRMPVPGGWLYRTYSVFYKGYSPGNESQPPNVILGSVAIAFVPFPNAPSSALVD